MLPLIAAAVVVSFVVSVGTSLIVSTRRAASLRDVPSIDLVLDQRPSRTLRNRSLV